MNNKYEKIVVNGQVLDKDDPKHPYGDLQVRHDSKLRHKTLVVGDTEAQVTEHVLRAYPGEYKEAPTLGAHVTDLLHGAPDPFWKGHTMEMLQSQLINVSTIAIDGTTITIE